MNASSLFNDGIHLITSFLPHRDWLQASLTCHRWYNIAAHFEPHREILLSPLTLSDVNLLLSSSSPLSRHVTGLTSVHPEDYHLRSRRVDLYLTLRGFSNIAPIAQKLPQLQVLDLFIRKDDSEDQAASHYFRSQQLPTCTDTTESQFCSSPASSFENTPTVDSNYALIHRFLTGEDFGVSSSRISSSPSSFSLPSSYIKTTYNFPHLHTLTIRVSLTESRFDLTYFLTQLSVSCPKLQYFTLEDESRWREGSTTNVAVIKEIMMIVAQHLQSIKQIELNLSLEPARTIIYAQNHHLYLPNCVLPTWTLFSADSLERVLSVLPEQTEFIIRELLSDHQLRILQKFHRLKSVSLTDTENSNPFTPSLIDALSNCRTITQLEFELHSPSAEVWSQLFTSLPQLTSIHIRPVNENYDVITLLIPFATRIRQLRLMSHGITFNRRTLRSLRLHFTALRSLTLLDVRFLSDPDEYDVLVTEEERNQLLRADSYASETRLKERFNEAWMLPRLEYFSIGHNLNHCFTWNQKRGTNTDKYRINTPPKAHLVGIEPNPGPN